MKYSKKKMRVWKMLLPAMVLVLGCICLSHILYRSYAKNLQQEQTITELNAMTYAERMTADLSGGIAITESLQEILISENGKIDNFPQVAEDLMTDAIQSIQIAPNGMVTDIYPEAGNEAGKIDLINDPDRGAIIRVPDIFSNSVQALTGFGYDYRLSKTASPLATEFEEISSSGAVLDRPISYEFELGGCTFKLEVMPSGGWNQDSKLHILFWGGLVIILLLTGLTIATLVLEERRETLKRISTTDTLTGLLNRKGFEEQFNRFLKKNPDASCVGVQLDVDNFKFINDMYGHATGDLALQELARSIRETFPEHAILSRSGGDEFSLILTETTCEAAEEKIKAFTTMPRYFEYDGEKHSFGISLGYAEYPADSPEVSDLLRNADVALYEVKLQGKNSCLSYSHDFKPQKRSRLGFALRDISQNLPGAFLIYIADPEDDRILFANREMIEFAGCKDLDDFLSYTDYHFRSLIRPDEREAVEKSIWDQIDARTSGNNDYVQFHFAKKDGTYHPVLDHGRIVENTYYGKIFYVIIMDCALIETHYDR